MEKELEYLYSLKQDYRSHLVSLRGRLQRQRMWLFTSALILICLQFLNLKLDEINLFGIKLQSIDISKVLFLVPLIITYQFAHYYVTKIEERRVNITLKSIVNTIEEKVGLSLVDLSGRHPWVSRHGTYYNVQHRNKFALFSVSLLNTVLWIPVLLVFVVGATAGLGSVVQARDILALWIYIITLVACIAVVICARLSSVFAYRQGRRLEQSPSGKSPEDNKQVQPT